MFDIIIIGGGCAGLSAAIYAVRAGKSVLVLESKLYGGQIVASKEVENYPGIAHISGYEFATKLQKQAIDLGAVCKREEVLEMTYETPHRIKTTKDSYDAKTVIVATGASNRSLELNREEQLIGKGISYCATCDGMFYRDKEVAVVGGGNTAFEDAIFLSNYCSKVYLIHRRETFRADAVLIEQAKNKNVEILTNMVLTDLGKEERIQEIEIKNVLTNERKMLKIDGVFVAIGQVPNTKLFANRLEMDQTGYIVANESCETNYETVFVAGDCRSKNVRQLITAANDGAVAALAACECIEKISS